MKTLIALGFVLCPIALVAKDPDPKLATARKAFVVAADELGDDVGVATCFAAHLHDLTPVEVVKTKEEAEIVFKVSAHLPSTTTKVLVGALGGSPSAHLFAELPDGTKLW